MRSRSITMRFNPYDDYLDGNLALIKEILSDHRMRSVIETGSRFLLNPYRKHSPTLISRPEGRKHRLDFLRHAIGIAVFLGSDAVSFWSGKAEGIDDPDEQMALLIDGCRTLCEYADELDVRLAFEPEPGMVIDTMSRFAELHDRVNHPSFGLTLDIGHLYCLGEVPILPHLECWKDVLWNVHLEDMKRGVHDHLMFGEGTMDFPPIFDALRDVGYAGSVNVELSRHSHMGVEAVRRSRAFLGPLIHGRSGPTTSRLTSAPPS